MRLNLGTSSIRRALIAIVLASLLPALGIILLNGLEARRHSLSDAREQALLLARSIGELQERTTQGVLRLLTVLSQTPELKDLQADEASRLLSSIIAADPVMANISVAVPDGTVIASALPSGPMNIADRPYFQRALRDGRFTAGEYHIGKASQVPIFPYALPIAGADGRVRGAIVAAVAVDSYIQLFKDAKLPELSVLSIVDRNGYRICRFPSDKTFKAGSALPAGLWDIMKSSGERGTAVLNGADGVRRIYGFTLQRLAGDEEPYSYIFVGIPESLGLATANALLRRNLTLLAAAAALAFAIAWFLWKPVLGRRIDRLVDVAEKISEGDFSTRISSPAQSGELGRLERRVNAMAQALAESAQKQALYEAALRSASADLEVKVRERTAQLSEANLLLKSEMVERGRAQERLAGSEKRYRSLYEQAAAGILILDSKGAVVDANPTALSLFGYSKQEMTGLDYAGLVHPESLKDLPIGLPAVTSGETFRAERVYTAKDGSNFPADVAANQIDGGLIQVVVTDSTQRKKLEQLREDVERITRHDLKTPLIGIVQLPELLLRGENLTERQREITLMIREAGYRMLRTINMSMALYKMETHTYECERAEFNLLGTAIIAATATGRLGESRNVSVRVLLDGAPPAAKDRFLAHGEEHLCVTMLENLLKNAIEASPDNEEVSVVFSTRERSLTIRNKGEVPDGMRGRFFEKYSTEGKKWGTGLGTYSAWLIASTHGWSIRLDCSVPGETRITVSFSQEADGASS